MCSQYLIPQQTYFRLTKQYFIEQINCNLITLSNREKHFGHGSFCEIQSVSVSMELQSVSQCRTHSALSDILLKRGAVFAEDTRLFAYYCLEINDEGTLHFVVEERLKPKSLGSVRIEKRLMPKSLGTFRTEARFQPIPCSALATLAHHSFSVVLVLTYPTYKHFSPTRKWKQLTR